jgi:hypothetical protein
MLMQQLLQRKLLPLNCVGTQTRLGREGMDMQKLTQQLLSQRQQLSQRKPLPI